MANFLVFAGTTEGRRLVETLHEGGASVCASVATEHGKMLLPEGVRVFAERLEAEEMATLMQSLSFDCVIDATHPHAIIVSENIKAACAFADVRYLRLLRPASMTGDCVYVENASKAAEILSAITGRVLLTTGSKELKHFTTIPDFAARVFPRVLPASESLAHCLDCGYPVQNIIAMQGPFSRELNCAMMRQIGAKIIVTKDSGENSGFAEKLLAAQDLGATAVVIGRPKEENGLLLADLMAVLEREYGFFYSNTPLEEKQYFPFFENLAPQRLLVVGANAATARWIKMLLNFTQHIAVIAPQFVSQFDALEVICIERTYLQGDCAGYDRVLAMTGHEQVDQAVMQDAKTAKIPVFSISDQISSDFLLPQVIQQEGATIGMLDRTSNRRLKEPVVLEGL